MVTFDGEDKIHTIRQSWDQGALLKGLEVIGKSGRNWPIRDGQEQAKLITKVTGKAAESQRESLARTRTNSTNAMRDPHTSLHHFNSREQEEPSDVVSPKAGVRPQQRSFTDILGDQPEEDYGDRAQSPTRHIGARSGAGKNFQPQRIFEAHHGHADDSDDTHENQKSPQRAYKTHPNKYSHFDFADGSDPADAPSAGVAMNEMPKTKHRSQWDFDDFVTPQKAKPGKVVRTQDVRHWGTEEGEEQQTPAFRPNVPKPRRDAQKHFEIEDEDLAPNERRENSRGAMQSKGQGLYQHNDDESVPEPRALGNITNVKDRSKDFGPHFNMTDDSPQADPNKAAPHVSDDRKKAVNMMQSSWDTYDESPNSQKENSHPRNSANALISQDLHDNGPNQRIKLGGDGMGNPKGGRGWSIGDDYEDSPDYRKENNPMGKRPAPKYSSDPTEIGATERIKLAGDGMGNPKGGRGWSIGDDSDEEKQAAAVPGKKQGLQSKAGATFSTVPGKKQGTQQSTSGRNFWDF